MDAVGDTQELCPECGLPHVEGGSSCWAELYPPLTPDDRVRLLMTLFEGYEEILAEERVTKKR